MGLQRRLDDDHDAAVERRPETESVGASDAAESEGSDVAAPDAKQVPTAVRATALSSAAAADIVRSRDLVDVYFHQMGGGEFLTREQEIELAQRIEAGQRAILDGLARVPMLIGLVAEWRGALEEGRVRVRDLVEMAMLENEERDELAEEPDDSESSADEEAGGELARREAKLMPAVLARLERIAALADEVAGLVQERVGLLAQGSDVGEDAEARIGDLLAEAGRELAELHLHPERIAARVAPGMALVASIAYAAMFLLLGTVTRHAVVFGLGSLGQPHGEL